MRRLTLALLLCCLTASAATHVQGGRTIGGTTSIAVTLGSTPIAGNLLMLAIISYNNNSASAPTFSCADGNSNAFTMTANAGGQPTYNGIGAIGYILSAPANITATITCTPSLTAGGFIALWVDEFSYSGRAALDATVSATGTGTAATSPTLTVSAGSTDVLYAFVVEINGQATAGAPWTAGASGSAYTGSYLAAYVSAATVATAVNWSFTSSVSWASLGTSIKFLLSGSQPIIF